MSNCQFRILEKKLFLQAAREINKRACKIVGWTSCWAYYFKTLNLCMNRRCHFFIFNQSVISLSISKAFIRCFVNYACISVEPIKNHQISCIGFCLSALSSIINSWLWIDELFLQIIYHNSNNLSLSHTTCQWPVNFWRSFDDFPKWWVVLQNKLVDIWNRKTTETKLSLICDMMRCLIN